MSGRIIRTESDFHTGRWLELLSPNKTLDQNLNKEIGQYPGNVPPPSKPEDSIFCKTVNSYGMKVNITI